MKKLNELYKTEKLELIKAIANGEINPDDVTNETRFISKRDEFFIGIMIAAGSPELKIINIGQAREAFKTMMERIENNRIEHQRFEDKINQVRNENNK